MTANSRPPLELLERLLQALPTMTMARAADYIAEDIVIDVPAILPHGGVYRGTAGYIGLIETVGRTCPSWHFTIDHTLSDGEATVMVQARVSAHASTGPWSMAVMERYRFAADKLAELDLFWHDTWKASELLRDSCTNTILAD